MEDLIPHDLPQMFQKKSSRVLQHLLMLLVHTESFWIIRCIGEERQYLILVNNADESFQWCTYRIHVPFEGLRSQHLPIEKALIPGYQPSREVFTVVFMQKLLKPRVVYWSPSLK